MSSLRDSILNDISQLKLPTKQVDISFFDYIGATLKEREVLRRLEADESRMKALKLCGLVGVKYNRILDLGE